MPKEGYLYCGHNRTLEIQHFWWWLLLHLLAEPLHQGGSLIETKRKSTLSVAPIITLNIKSKFQIPDPKTQNLKGS